MKEALFYEKLPEQNAACKLCRHACVIKNNKVGICKVRQNINGQLFSLIYGRPASLNADPIEKKPLFHFLPGSLSYSLGTLGCNFKCSNCQNWELSQPKNTPPLNPPLSGGTVEPEAIIEQAVVNGCRSISYTYNEPTVFTEYALDVMKLARNQKLKNVWVTNGYMTQDCLNAILPYLDAANVDLKSFDDGFYLKNCGARLAPVLENLLTIKQAGVHLEITTLIIPGLSDDAGMLKQAAEFIARGLGADTPWHLSKFSPEISWKLKRTPSTPDRALISAYELGKASGLKYVYLGNLPGDERENTFCSNCGQLAISRFGFNIERLDKRGRCAYCDQALDITE